MTSVRPAAQPQRPRAGLSRSASSSAPPRAKTARARIPYGSPVTVEGVRITNPQRRIALANGVSKLDLVHYHVKLADLLLREVGTRPLGIIRCPGGELRTCFYQRHANARMPDARRATGRDPSPPWLRLTSLADVLRAVQNGAFEFHSWGSRFPDIQRADRLTLDLDPDTAMPWEVFRGACEDVRALLDSLELRWFVKTTGGKGLHFVLPLERRYGFDEVKTFARAIALRLTEESPSLFVAHASKADRAGRVFVDYLRNAEGATAVAAYSVRARAGLPVSMPVAWSDLARDVRGDHFNVRNVPARVASRKRDPWQAYESCRQRISAAQRRALGIR